MMKKLHIITAALAVATFSCKKDKTTETITDDVNKPVKVVTTEKLKTILTDENYALAESQVIFKAYLSKIAAATNTDGMGVFMHNRKALDPKDKTVVRINFDTQYSSAILDLTEEDRYQKANGFMFRAGVGFPQTIYIGAGYSF